MNCNTDTSISEFLAGISLLSVAVHVGIVYFMRPRIVNIRFDPTWSLLDRKSNNIHIASSDSDSDSSSEKDQVEDTTEIPVHIETNKKDNDDGGSFYSYFT